MPPLINVGFGVLVFGVWGLRCKLSASTILPPLTIVWLGVWCCGVQGYLAHEKQRPLRTLGRGADSYERGTPVRNLLSLRLLGRAKKFTTQFDAILVILALV